MSAYFDFASVQAKLGETLSYAPKFILNPTSLAALALPVEVQWENQVFNQQNVDSITDTPGIYAFAIQHAASGLPSHGYVLYIGEAGAKKGKGRTLRARFKEYFREKAKPKRQHVAYFLNAWETCLVFHFVSLDPNEVNLLEVEMKLNDAMMPPFSRGDFSPEIRPMKRLAEAF